MFNQTKYTRVYHNIIANAKSRILEEEYIEKHHIIPKSLGGSNSEDNLVALTAREHFICHWLLTKMVLGEAKQKMVLALSFMQGRNKSQTKYTNKITARVYARIRQEVANICKANNQKRVVTEETKQKISDSLKGKARSNETKQKISTAHLGKTRSTEHRKSISTAKIGTKRSEETKQNMRKKHKPLSEETKRKMSESKKGRVPWNKGLTKETDLRVEQNGKAVSENRKGKKDGKL